MIPKILLCPEDNVLCVAIDSHGQFWLGTNSEGLVRFDGTDWTFINTFKQITAIAIDKNGTKWVGTRDKGLLMFNKPGQFTLWRKPNPNEQYEFWTNFTNNNISTIAVQDGSIIRVGYGTIPRQSSAGMASYYVDTKTWGYSYNIPPTSITSIGFDGDTIFAGTADAGIYRYTGYWKTYTTSNTKLTTNRISGVVVDQNGNKWFSTYGSGLIKYKGD